MKQKILGKNSSVLSHGGDVESVSRRYGIALADWVDLSTCISPLSYPNTVVSRKAFTRMPYQQESFHRAVRTYYGNDNFIATNGSQQVISVLPACLTSLPIVLPDMGYREHQLAWEAAGAELIFYPAHKPSAAKLAIEKLLNAGKAFHLLVINPNNPTCCAFPPDTLTQWAQRLDDNACLIVDEAFADIDPAQSVLASGLTKNTIVLRSFGKFFGLPGLRLGFVFADKGILAKIRSYVGIWDVNGPAQEIAIAALDDRAWQTDIRVRLREVTINNRKMWQGLIDALKDRKQLVSQTHHVLFSSYVLSTAVAEFIFDFFAQHGVLLRIIPVDHSCSLIRIGLADPRGARNVEKIIQKSLCALESDVACYQLED